MLGVGQVIPSRTGGGGRAAAAVPGVSCTANLGPSPHASLLELRGFGCFLPLWAGLGWGPREKRCPAPFSKSTGPGSLETGRLIQDMCKCFYYKLS